MDGDVLPTTPWQALADGAGRDIELIAGHTRDEYQFFLPPRPGAVAEQEASRALAVHGPDPNAEPAYRSAFPNTSAEQLWVLVRSDRLFRIPSLRLAESQARGGGRAYLHEPAWPAQGAAFPEQDSRRLWQDHEFPPLPLRH